MEKEFKPYVQHPCELCPFKKDCPPGWLGRSRAEELAESARKRVFTCHLTDRPTRNVEKKKKIKHCAGAALTLLNEDIMNNHMRAAIYYLRYDFSQIKGRNLAFDTLEEFVNHHSK